MEVYIALEPDCAGDELSGWNQHPPALGCMAGGNSPLKRVCAIGLVIANGAKLCYIEIAIRKYRCFDSSQDGRRL
jgi:hypothetical protein